MKMFDAATIKDKAEVFASKTMLAAMAVLCIRFFRAYMAASVWFYTIIAAPFFTCAYARKRITNRVTHHRKFALFPKNPNSRAGLFGPMETEAPRAQKLPVRSA
jgi:hypothetical protein